MQKEQSTTVHYGDVGRRSTLCGMNHTTKTGKPLAKWTPSKDHVTCAGCKAYLASRK